MHHSSTLHVTHFPGILYSLSLRLFSCTCWCNSAFSACFVLILPTPFDVWLCLVSLLVELMQSNLEIWMTQTPPISGTTFLVSQMIIMYYLASISWKPWISRTIMPMLPSSYSYHGCTVSPTSTAFWPIHWLLYYATFTPHLINYWQNWMMSP